MTQAIDGVKLLHRRIQDALSAVRGARDTHEHCPSIENLTNLQAAERYLDTLLADQRISRRQDVT